MREQVKGMKKEQQETTTLTPFECSAVWRVLDAVIGDGKVSYNKDMGQYTDDGDIVICLDNTEFQAARRAYDKLLKMSWEAQKV